MNNSECMLPGGHQRRKNRGENDRREGGWGRRTSFEKKRAVFY
ncbi:unnamed protein product [Spirodela intermedia]|uniref:Uncharacterized protein n=2 Tax=Spirodela intermedia TaxID=51605 RepID=A0A7I8IEG4_SPIIN|nr:unnamed protein product [Spirodela intermedia]CAA6655262.1 unnamed protein product [Spirodela intermedia]CAA7390472.1 unnamed protein product [Spirodela intermedia]